MIPRIAYHRPATLAEACELGQRLGAEAAFLAGGTELLPDYHRDRETAIQLIALDRLEELRAIRVAEGQLRIGALATMAEVARSPLVREWSPALAQAAACVGYPAIRNRATIGGNFCRAVPCADTPPPAIAAGAVLQLVGPDGPRALDAARFFVGPRRTALRPGEVLVDVIVPPQPEHSAVSYQRFARRGGSALAVAALAARITLRQGRIRDARIVLGAVAPTPLPAARAVAMLDGEPPSADLFALAAAMSAEEARPITDVRGTAEFRRRLVAVLTRRALEQATHRAGGAIP